MRKPRDLSDPAFPHGTNRGYVYGCRRTTSPTCPAKETCSQVHAAEQRRWRTAHGSHVGQAKTVFVVRRIEETIAAVGRDALCTHLGITPAAVTRALNTKTINMARARAEPFDQAWALLVKGVDVAEVGFPHGEARGYSAFCRCTPCTTAASRAQVRRATGRKIAGSIITDARALRAVRAHVTELRAHGQPAQIARAAGISHYSVTRALASDTQAMRLKILAALMATTAEQVEAQIAEGDYISAAETHWMLQTLRAQGYAWAWLSQAVESSEKHLRRINPAGKVTVAFARQVAATHATYGDVAATPTATGQSEWTIALAMRRARAAGWYPPSAYDENKNLIDRALPDHPWSVQDEFAAQRLSYVGYLIAGMSALDAAGKAGGNSRTLARVRHGLTYSRGTQDGLDYKASAARIAEIRSVVADWESGLVGPLTAAMTLGLRSTPPERPREGEHPEETEWRAAHRAPLSA